MNSILTLITAGFVLAASATAQSPRYTITDLGGGPFGQANIVTNNGLIVGFAPVAGAAQHATLWYGGLKLDIGAHGLGGPNSAAFGANERGEAGGLAESSDPDPNHENFCAYGTGLKCLAFVWQNGVMTALPTLGGNNGQGGPINNRGEMIGIAETATRDPECPSGVSISGPGPQVLDYEAAVWGPNGEIRELRPLPGDSVGMGFWINDNGEAVGASGSCANTILPPIAASRHAVLWEKNGSPVDLGNLGGTINPALLGVGNGAFAINNKTQVAGVSALSGNTVAHAFLWTRGTGMRDLGTLPGDVNTAGLGINDQGEVVGPSADPDGNLRAYLWTDGVMNDLNTLIPNSSPLFLLLAFNINSRGEIVGFGVQKSAPYEIHAFLLTPSPDPQDRRLVSPVSPNGSREGGAFTLPESVRSLIRQRLSYGRFGVRLAEPR
jgi:probable HAF family extracellular repeat protein